MKLNVADFGKLILRIGTGGLMLFHGVHKLLHGFEGIKSMLVAAHLPQWLWIGVPVGEIIAPLLLILGICGRLSAVTLMFTMIMSIYLAFGWSAFEIGAMGGLKAELNLLYICAAAAILLLGKGKYALQKKDSGLFA
ncbi:MAG: DoxX family protein [Bacteroidales bacterium]|jgi:putative oxidoreductase|nr:DoxX family protein [Bacteroidales bacterium]